MKNVIIFDNGGKTFDRYTILNRITGDINGASENPYHPQGFGQYCGNVADNYWCAAYGNGWRLNATDKYIKKLERFAINRFIKEFGDPVVKFDTIPDAVQKYVIQVTTPEIA